MRTPDIAGLCEKLRMRSAARLSLKCPSKTDRADAELDTTSADTLERQAAEIERLRGALGDTTATLASISGLAQSATKAAVKGLQTRAALTGEDA